MFYQLLKTVLTPPTAVPLPGPREGPRACAGNRSGHRCEQSLVVLRLDLPASGAPSRITFAAKAEYFENPRTAWILRALGQIPVNRAGGLAAQRALDSAKDILDAGGLFGIYPERTRSRDGRLHRGRTGVARLAMECQVPVLAVGMIGTAALQPVGRTLPHLFKPVGINISAPLSLDNRSLESRTSSAARRHITDNIMLAVGRQSGQEYVS